MKKTKMPSRQVVKPESYQNPALDGGQDIWKKIFPHGFHSASVNQASASTKREQARGSNMSFLQVSMAEHW